MTRKLPAAFLIAALLIAIPGLLSSIGSGSTAVALTPGVADTGQLGVEERVAFWSERIAGPGDHLNRVQAAVAMQEAARQSGDPADLAAALAMAEAAIGANPSSLDARTARAAILASDHRFDEALVEVGVVLAADPDAFQARAVGADASLELGRYDDARHHLDALVATQPDAPAVLARQAEYAWDTDDPASALAFGRQALDRANEAAFSPGELSFYAIRLARFHLDTGDVDEAEALATAALEIAPHVPAVHSTVGFVRQAQGDVDAAIHAFEQAIAITPLREALVELEALYLETGDEAAAAEVTDMLADRG